MDNINVKNNNMNENEFEAFTSRLQDKIFEETSMYISNVIGTEDWGVEMHAIHGLIMYNAVKVIAKGILKE